MAPSGSSATKSRAPQSNDDVEFEITFSHTTSPPPGVVGSIAPSPAPVNASEERENARLAEIFAQNKREEQRLHDLLVENDRHERALRDWQRQRDQEQQRLAELRFFSGQRDACRKFDIAACETALRSPHASTQDAIDLQSWRAVALKFRADLEVCRVGSVAACDAAITSPALADGQRHLLQQWRAAASPFNRVLVWLSGYAGIVATVATDAITTIRDLPTSTHVTGGIAAVLTLALAAIALRRRSEPSSGVTIPVTPLRSAPEIATAGGDPTTDQASPSLAPRNRLAAFLGQWFPRWSRLAPEPSPANAQAPSPPPVMARDSPGAIAALELAYAYIEEVRQADTPGLEDHDLRKHHLNTLALASKQLAVAQLLDPDAILEGQDDKEIPYRYSINELKAEALLLEGITHQTYDTKRAVPALRKATTLNPNSSRAFYVLGLTHAANMNRGAAVAAFERAVALDPKNLSYRKELNRAQSLSVGVVAAYKATRAGERIFDAGVKTANVGIFIYNIGVYAWNIFAITWNIVTFPLRVVFAMFRLFRFI
jgi:tetratricopeptide (TPR) repeat protein